MNPKRLILAIIAVFAGVFATDFLIHHVWLMGDYKASASLWRPENEMGGHIGWLFGGELLAAVAFVMIYAKGFADKACPLCAVMFGLFMALFSQANTLISYAVQPLPGNLAAKWVVAAVAQGILIGLIVFFVYKPKPCDEKSDCCNEKK